MVRCWGNNDLGQFDPPAGLTGVVRVSAAYGNTAALTAAGVIHVCGYEVPGGNDVPADMGLARAVETGGGLVRRRSPRWHGRLLGIQHHWTVNRTTATAKIANAPPCRQELHFSAAQLRLAHGNTLRSGFVGRSATPPQERLTKFMMP